MVPLSFCKIMHKISIAGDIFLICIQRNVQWHKSVYLIGSYEKVGILMQLYRILEPSLQCECGKFYSFVYIFSTL